MLALQLPPHPPKSTPSDPAGWRSFLRPVSPVDATVGDLVDAWLDHVEKTAPKSTLRDAKSAAKNHLTPAFGDLSPADVTGECVAAWIEWKKSHGLADKTVRKLVSHLSSVYEVARLGDVRNPTRDLPRGALPSNRPVDPRRARLSILTLAETSALLSCDAIPVRRRVLWGMLLLGGLRFGEAAAAKWWALRPAVPLDVLDVAESWDSAAHEAGAPKNGITRRVPIHPRLAQLFDEARAWQTEVLGREPAPGDLISPYQPPKSGPWAPRHWQEKTALRAWRRDLQIAGIEPGPAGDRTMHHARHTFVSRLHQAGAHPKAITAITHDEDAAPRNAHDVYVHLEWADYCRAVLALEVPNA